MQKTNTPIDTRTEPSRLARWATALAATLVLAPTALGAQRPAPAPPARPVVAQAPQGAPAPPAQAEPDEIPEPPEPAEPAEAPEPPDADFDYDFNMPDITMPDVTVVIPAM